jgi:hypothetical protein
MKNSIISKWAVINAFGVFIYVFLLTSFISQASNWFGKTDQNIITPMAALMLFVFSALVTGGLVLGRPIMLFLDGHRKDSVKLLFFTGAYLFIFMFLTFITLLIIK